MDVEQQEMIKEFIAESLDMLETVEPMIISLTQELDNDEKREAVNTMFRLFHSLKGGAGFLNLDTIKEVTHTAESLLQHFRKDPTIIDPEIVDTLTRAGDLIRQLLEQVQTQFEDAGFEEEASLLIQELKKNLQRVLEQKGKPQEAQKNLHEAQKEIQEESSPMVEETETDPSSLPANEGIDFAELLLTLEMTQSFIQEAEEQVEIAEGALLVVKQLQDDADNVSFIETAFRQIHTLKGNSGFLGLVPIEQLSHKTESVLGALKEGTLKVTEEVIQVLLRVVDTLRSGIKMLAEEQKLEMPDVDLVFSQLTAILEGKSLPENSDSEAVASPEQAAETTTAEAFPEPFAPPALPPAPPESENPPLSDPPEEKKIQPEAGNPSADTSAQTVAKSSTPLKQADIRVSIDKIDQLINLVGELVISEAMVTHNPDLASLESERFVKSVRQLNKNVRDLQEVAMSMRMLPISGTFRKMIRVVHDVSRKVGKNVELKLAGEETEVDRTIVEKIADPLLHIIRNAVDHGIDTPEERITAGKPEMGSLLLEAKHSGNEIWITVSDDGRGLHREKILSRAKERGLIDPGAEPLDSEVWKMIFLPGFSTAEAVTDFSGRGVGMDVVKRNIEKLHGRIDVTSTTGKGSHFILRIPLTLAIIEGMLVRVGGVIYVIPIVGTRESLQPKQETITTTNGMEVVRIRDELIPVVRLHDLHQLQPDSMDLTDGIVIVIEDEESRVCLFVDEVVGERQVVVKGLPQYFGEVPHLAGCTILGDGDISLILDLVSIIYTA